MNKPELEGTAHLLDELDSNKILYISFRSNNYRLLIIIKKKCGRCDYSSVIEKYR